MIGVLGATGRVGRHVAAGLAERGVEARALVRRPDRGARRCPRCTPTLSSPATLAAALDGVERLLLLTAHGPDQDLREAAAIEAAVAAGVQRIVKISGGAPTLGPNGTTPTAVAHWHSEQRIERSGLDFAFLRPSFYMQNLLDTVAPTGRGERHARGPVRARPDRDGRRPRRRGLRDRRAARRAHRAGAPGSSPARARSASTRSPSIWASATSTCR